MSFTIKQILTPVDFSETSQEALDHAIFMAKIFNAKLFFVHVIEPSSYQFQMAEMVTLNDKIKNLAYDKLDELANSVHVEHGIYKPEILIESGNISAQIVDAADKIKASIIVMGTHGVSGFAEFFIGSNAYKVATQSSCPVLTVQRHATRKGFKNIVLPVDDSHSSRQKVVQAVEFAKHYGSVVHVVELMPDNDPATLHKFEVIKKQVNDYLDAHDIPKKNKVLVGDNIAKLTMKYANDNDADLIMIMTEQDESITGFIMGPSAQQVVNHSQVPVLSITPEETYIPIGGM
jgi:nucleotide-binding universal stress UspA family protein